jgi:phosphatidylserine/phosphatidylglycerophosphate/cardiolipin synthase-like enzyme
VSELTRTLRTGARMGLSAESILSTALLSELACPGESVWLVSGWITDIEVLDNRQGAFDPVLGDSSQPFWRLSQVLALIAAAGTRLHVVTRPAAHNEMFLRNLRAAVTDSTRLHITLDPAIHEKTICGREWVFSGSMNFTVNGLGSNEESVTYLVSEREAAQAQLDFAERWRDQDDPHD